MRLSSAVLAACALCAAVPASAEIDPAKAQSVIGYFRSYGCALNEAQVGLFMGDMGVTDAEYAEVLTDLVARGFATGDAAVLGGVTLTPEFCGPRSSDQRASLIAIMRYQGCAITQEEMPNLLMPAGFMPDDLRPVIGAMIEAGEAIPDGSTLRLSEALCAG
jgi:hypothetical protein